MSHNHGASTWHISSLWITLDRINNHYSIHYTRTQSCGEFVIPLPTWKIIYISEHLLITYAQSLPASHSINSRLGVGFSIFLCLIVGSRTQINDCCSQQTSNTTQHLRFPMRSTQIVINNSLQWQQNYDLSNIENNGVILDQANMLATCITKTFWFAK